MKIKGLLRVKGYVLVAGIIFSTNSMADDKLWIVSAGLSYHDTSFNLPTNRYNNDSWTTNLGLMRKLNDRTWLGGNISFTNGDVDYKSFTGSTSIDTPSVNLYLMRELAWGLYADGSIGYGKPRIDTNTVNVRYNANAKFTTASLGLTQYIPVTQNLMSSISTHYSHISSDFDNFVTNLGTAVPSSNKSLNYITLGGQLAYQLDKWSPYIKLDWNKANREFLIGTGDKDYFSYGVGIRYAISNETSIGLGVGSVFGKRDAHETNASISFSHQF